MALTLWLTSSSLSLPAAAIALLVFLILAPDRLPKLATLAFAAAGSAILFAAAEQREALDRGLATPAALHEGDELRTFLLIVCVGVALAQAGLGLAVRYGERPRWLRIPREWAIVGSITVVGAIVVVGLTLGLAGEVSDKWGEFKQQGGNSTPGGSRASQILDVSSSGRYQFWESAVDAAKTDPLLGIGPGTFEFWWSRKGVYAGFIRDAHSLYLETLAELGIIGLALVAAFLITVLTIGTARAMRAPPELRLGIAAAVAGCAAFAATAAVDWTWELGVLPVALAMLAAVAVAGGSDAKRSRRRYSDSHPAIAFVRRNSASIAIVVLAVAAITAIALPLASTMAVAESRADSQAGSLTKALDEARDAAAIQPYAATPRVQEALILERLGELDAAVKSARAATQKEATNWRTWLIRSRLEARTGDTRASVAAYRQARLLNPGSGALAPGEATP